MSNPFGNFANPAQSSKTPLNLSTTQSNTSPFFMNPKTESTNKPITNPPQESSSSFFLNQKSSLPDNSKPLSAFSAQISTEPKKIDFGIATGYKAKIMEMFTNWKSKFDALYAAFKKNSEKLSKNEVNFYENQEEIIAMQELIQKIGSASQGINDNLDMILEEQKEINASLEEIEEGLDEILSKFEVHSSKSGSDERKLIYAKANIVNKNLEEIKKVLDEVDGCMHYENGDSDGSLCTLLENINTIEANSYFLDSNINSIENQYKMKKKSK
ncbi:unnamed protein product [Blepharisma stoltei]|uniref:Nucleoporin NSP1-like C-terminal domain-containing protein n=1 Tax=Blepharisma stoltei TaxID=1481888 RepID=A0AAU9JBE6_9CILI|nr:unnamed protein product [Blepharisma stoltei]